jgi:hypothetical protein
MIATLQLEAFFSPLLEDRMVTKKNTYINNILSSLKGMCSVKSNMIFNNKMCDILFEKGKKIVAVYIPIDNLNTTTVVENNEVNDNIIEIILTLLNRRSSKNKFIQSNNFDKYKEVIDSFYSDSIVSCQHSTLTKRELISYFGKWCEEHFIKISNKVLFYYMNDYIGVYKNGWNGYKLNYGIMEDDFE